MHDSPLQSLLSRLSDGKLRTKLELAEDLDTSPDLIDQMLIDLRRAGYIEPVEQSCSEKCAHCAQSGGCSLSFAGKIWRLTERGDRAAQTS